jgi:outer membrane protein assembly factor BamB
MKLKKTSIVVAVVLMAMLLSACSAISSTGFPSGTVDKDVLYLAGGGAVLAIRPDGSQIWRYPDKLDANKTFFGTPAVVNGLVLVGDYQNTLFALDSASGAEKWTFPDAKGRYITGPIAVGDKIIAANGDGAIYALDASGKQLWKFDKATAGFWGAPTADKDIIYATSMDHTLYAIKAADGSEVWKVDMGGPVLAPTLLANDGTLYVGTLGNQMIAVKASDGSILWKYDTTGAIWSEPYFKDGVLYFGDMSNKIYAIKAADKSVVWTSDAPGPVIASPADITTGLVFVCETGDVLTLGYQNEKSWTDKVTNGKLFSMPVVFGDRLVVPVDQGDPLLITYDFSGRKGWTFAAPK